MKIVLKIYRFLNLVSLDVACGAVICSAFFAHLFQVQPRPAGFLALGISVWIIYSADHLMDAYMLDQKASTTRHRFHQKYFRTIAFLLIVAAIMNVILVLYIRRPVLIGGLVLAALIFPYLLVQKYIHPFKELLVSVLYSGGVLVPTLALHTSAISLTVTLLVVNFTITALINLIVFSWYEWEQDRIDGRVSIVTWLGKSNAKIVIWVLCLIQMVIFLVVLWKGAFLFALLTIVVMNVILLIIFAYPQKLRDDDKYRLVGDAAFILPVLYILLNG
jgi:4-hydroxybenzoate polyprenyltransferase